MKELQILAGLFSTLMVVIALGVVGGLVWFSHEFQKPGPHDADAIILIESGSGLHSITRQLFEKDTISHAMLFKMGAKIHGAETQLQAGEYKIAARASMEEILTLLRNGQTLSHAFTIPEGKTSFEIVRLLNAVEGLEGEVTDIPAEGTLLPETYHFTTSTKEFIYI